MRLLHATLTCAIRLTFLSLVAAVSAQAAGPVDAAQAAAADVAKQPEATRPYLRYLYDPRSDEKTEKVRRPIYDFWANSLSSEADLTRLTHVRPDLFRLDVRDYGEKFAKSWEALSTREVYFYERDVVGVAVKGKPVFRKGADGKYAWITPVEAEAKTAKIAMARWLDPQASASLILYTGSQTPIARADWWLVETSQQVDRKGTGYYDTIGIKNRDEFFALAGFDQALSARLQKEMRAAVARSGVALNNRGIVRFQSVVGDVWITLDTNNNKGKRNALRNLNGDLQHDAEEIFLRRSNGLYAYFAGAADGTKQDSVPDTIASDKTRNGNDARIHFRNCVSCHREGIRPINDWVRKVYRAPLALTVTDPDRFRELRRKYLSNLTGQVQKDSESYAEVVFGLTGLKTEKLADEFGKRCDEYSEADLSLADVARETGYPVATITAVLKKVATLTPPLEPELAGLIAADPEPIRRDHFEGGFATLMIHLRGYLASNAKPKEVK